MSTRVAVASTRRLFVGDGGKYFQMMKFEQKRDGSIYMFWPEGEKLRWLRVVDSEPTVAELVSVPGADHLSVHGTGLAHVRASRDEDVEVRVKGNFLADPEGSALGVRHLLTVFPTEASYLPVSPAFNREADYVVQWRELKPWVFVMWAVPAHRPLVVDVGASFHLDEVDSVAESAQCGTFTLRTHAIVWLGYRTNHMERWPLETHAFYFDGFYVPKIVGEGVGGMRVGLITPEIRLEGDRLTIRI